MKEEKEKYSWSDWLENGQESPEISEADQALVKKAVDMVDSIKIPSFERQATWDKIQNNKSRNNNSKYLIYAVFLVIGIGLLSYLFLNSKTEESPYIEQVFPDNTKIFASERSSVDWQYKDGERNIQLSGIAFFNVAKGDRFSIETEYGDVTVLGTSFEVIALPEIFEVRCKTGKVDVSIDDQNFLLTAGHRITKLPNTVADHSKFDLSTLSPERPLYKFVDKSLVEVFAVYNHFFNEDIIVEENLKGRKFTGSIDLTSKLKSIEMICNPLGINFEISDSQDIRILER